MPKILNERLRGEYLEMPGLRLTGRQAERLCGVDSVSCKQVFDSLAREQFLPIKPDGTCPRVTDLATRCRLKEFV